MVHSVAKAAAPRSGIAERKSMQRRFNFMFGLRRSVVDADVAGVAALNVLWLWMTDQFRPSRIAVGQQKENPATGGVAVCLCRGMSHKETIQIVPNDRRDLNGQEFRKCIVENAATCHMFVMYGGDADACQ
jgi:hypothetical protein